MWQVDVVSSCKPSKIAALVICAIFLPASFSRNVTVPKVELKRVPDGGIQPQVAVDRSGTVHLVYFKGDPSAGDLFYARSNDGESFSSPIRVNSVLGTAVAIGNIRGARIAAGRNGNVYVVWNGSAKLGNPALGRSPMLFSRLNKSWAAFEPERNLIHTAYGIDGGAELRPISKGACMCFGTHPFPAGKARNSAACG